MLTSPSNGFKRSSLTACFLVQHKNSNLYTIDSYDRKQSGTLSLFLKALSTFILLSPIYTSVAATGPLTTANKDSVTVKLVAEKIVTQPDGKESFTSADKAGPGDIIEYKATYKNDGNADVKNLAATLPVPKNGMEYLSETAFPKPVKASVDGKTFEAIPLKRVITLQNGKSEIRLIPTSEYRFLRWEIPQIPAGKSMLVKARMKLNTEAVSQQPTQSK